ncbi:hypothetical protein ACFY36_22905 [Actinoplanes sp. NPDC000266]
MLQIVGGVAAAGVIAASATALTGSGLTRTTGANTAEDRWIGGTITQTLSGSNIDSISYTFADTAKTQISGFVVVASDAAQKYVTVTPNGAFGGSADRFICGPTVGWNANGSTATSSTGAGSPVKVQLANSTPASVTCVAATAPLTPGGYMSGVSSVDVLVAAS